MANRTYRERLLATGHDSLELRRLRRDLIFTYKSISNKLYTDKDGNMMTSSFPALIDIEVDNLFSFNSYSNTRGHVCKLYKTRCTKSVRQNFFLRAGLSISGWNSLPDIVGFSSQAGFSQSLNPLTATANEWRCAIRAIFGLYWG